MIAVYRNLYSHDFWSASVKSIRGVVDRVYGVVSRFPYGDVTTSPEELALIHKTMEVAADVCDSVIFQHFSSPVNQFTEIINDLLPDGDSVMIIDADMVWRKDQLALFLEESQAHDCCMSRQIEIWKGMKHRVPERPRQGCVIWNKRPLPPTQHLGWVQGMHVCQAQVHNLGFAVSEETMRVKDSISKKISSVIGDSLPNPDWINRWVNWQPGDKDLEISAGYEHDIPEVVPYSEGELPEGLRCG